MWLPTKRQLESRNKMTNQAKNSRWIAKGNFTQKATSRKISWCMGRTGKEAPTVEYVHNSSSFYVLILFSFKISVFKTL